MSHVCKEFELLSAKVCQSFEYALSFESQLMPMRKYMLRRRVRVEEKKRVSGPCLLEY